MKLESSFTWSKQDVFAFPIKTRRGKFGLILNLLQSLQSDEDLPKLLRVICPFRANICLCWVNNHQKQVSPTCVRSSLPPLHATDLIDTNLPETGRRWKQTDCEVETNSPHSPAQVLASKAQRAQLQLCVSVVKMYFTEKWKRCELACTARVRWYYWQLALGKLEGRRLEGWAQARRNVEFPFPLVTCDWIQRT